jgi:hypothetical protein
MMNERFIKAANSKNAYVCDESLHQLVGVLHVRHDHEEIIVGGSQQVRTEYDGQCVCRHLVVLLVVCDPRIRFVRGISTGETNQITCQGAQQHVSEYQNYVEAEPGLLSVFALSCY